MEKPKQTAGDVAIAVARGVISGVPIAGGVASEVFNLIVTPPLSRRRDEWIESIVAGLKDLQEKVEGFKIEDLSKNDVFITTVMHASQAAVRNHQKEKLDALRNAALNAALPTAPEEDLQTIFLSYIDTFTTWHIRILKLFDDPNQWFIKQGKKWPNLEFGALDHILNAAYPELAGSRGFSDQIFKELYDKGLVNTEGLHGTMTKNGLTAQRTSDLGKAFIKYITSPL